MMKNTNMESIKKIFIGGLAPHTTQTTFEEYFGQYGILKDWVLMWEKESKRSRGFGFVVYENAEDAWKIL